MTLFCAMFGHSFEPRFDTTPPRADEVAKIIDATDPYYDLDNVIEQLTATRWRGDVCVRCGSIARDRNGL